MPTLNDEREKEINRILFRLASQTVAGLWPGKDSQGQNATLIFAALRETRAAGAREEREAVLRLIHEYAPSDHCPIEPSNEDLDSGYDLGCSDTVCGLYSRIRQRGEEATPK